MKKVEMLEKLRCQQEPLTQAQKEYLFSYGTDLERTFILFNELKIANKRIAELEKVIKSY